MRLLSLDFEVEVEDEWDYECLTCGKTDLEDMDDDREGNRSNGGVIFTSNMFEIFICSYCKYFITGRE